MPEETNSTQQQLQQQPQVKDRSARPAGILPKNTQALVIAGIALVMVGAIVFSGGGSPKPKAKPSPATPAVIGPSQERIEEYRQQLNEQARKLAAQQAQFAQDRQALGVNPAAGAPGTTSPTGAPNYPSAYAQPQQPTEKDSIESDRKKREYASLFASNVALSYRKDAVQASAPASQASANNAALPDAASGARGLCFAGTAGKDPAFRFCAGQHMRKLPQARTANSNRQRPQNVGSSGATTRSTKPMASSTGSSRGRSLKVF